MTTVKVSHAAKWQYRTFAQHEALPGVELDGRQGQRLHPDVDEDQAPVPPDGDPWLQRPPADAQPRLRRHPDDRRADRERYGHANVWRPVGGGEPEPGAGDDRLRPAALDDFASIGWEDLQTGGAGLQLHVDVTPFRADCPLGPQPEIEWEGGESLCSPTWSPRSARASSSARSSSRSGAPRRSRA